MLRKVKLMFLCLLVGLLVLAPWQIWEEKEVRANSEFIRAVWYYWEYDSVGGQGYLSDGVSNDLLIIKQRLCPTHILIPVFVYQADKNASDPKIDPERTSSDSALENVIELVHQLGMRTILLPTLRVDDGFWQGEITPDSIETWFQSWNDILNHYARLAKKEDVDIFLLGAELETLRAQTQSWRGLITTVQHLYQGKISYSTNFWWDRDGYEIVKNMAQWEGLDFIGVTSYFELTDKQRPSIEELLTAWTNDRHGQNIVLDLQTLSQKFQKPIVFWEAGYQSKLGANIFPWNSDLDTPQDFEEQTNDWTALVETFKEKLWFNGYGIFLEKVGLSWNPQYSLAWDSRDYNVLFKPVEKVLGAHCQ